MKFRDCDDMLHAHVCDGGWIWGFSPMQFHIYSTYIQSLEGKLKNSMGINLYVRLVILFSCFINLPPLKSRIVIYLVKAQNDARI